MSTRFWSKVLLSGITAATTLFSIPSHAAGKVELLNVSYDPTRELYEDINKAFAAQWKSRTGQEVVIKQSHGGSGAQSRAVIDGLPADVVTLGVEAHVNAIAEKAQLLPENWKSLLPENSSPYTSTIVFLVHKGNPRHISDWPDLVRPGVQVITPNPKTSGAAQLAFLAAWSYAKHQPGGNDNKALAYVTELYHHVPVLDTGGRGATITFTRHGIGDVMVSWENEAHLALKDQPGEYEIVYPSSSILAEPPVAVVTKNALRHQSTALAEAYLKYLYTPQAQEIEAQNFYRPRDPQILAKYKATFPAIKLYTVDQDFGGWRKVEARFFDDGGIFDKIYSPQ